jgi:deoxyhypusine synthase
VLQGTVWTPSKVIHRLGKEINNPESVYYWCYKNDIPVFCPALTDGSLGDMLYFHCYKRAGFVLDIVGDIRGLNDIALAAKKSGVSRALVHDKHTSPCRARSRGLLTVGRVAVAQA